MMKFGIFGFFIVICCVGCSGSLFPLNTEDSAAKLMLKSVGLGDLKKVKLLLEIDKKLALISDSGQSLLWGLLRATRLKNKVEEAKLKDYAKIIKLLGENAAWSWIMKKGDIMMPLDYSLENCYPIIDRQLLKFEPKPMYYTPKTKKQKEEIAKFAGTCAEGAALFLTEYMLKMLSVPEEKLGKTFYEYSFYSLVKDSKGRLLTWVLRDNRKSLQDKNFSVKLLAGGTFICSASFKLSSPKEGGLGVYISLLETAISERQSGFGGIMIQALLKTFAKLDTKAIVSLLAHPMGFDERQSALFRPRLIHYYKTFGFSPMQYAPDILVMTILNGKILPTYEMDHGKPFLEVAVNFF
ncbi:TPA: hypothetical protein DDZ86_00985 [Candidatus Dependentiae bacterium]|nr:MAG: hypothetical protein UW09_C0004G0079 [candidate division TM6 bacterium GW2011_GWF2_43_87]HBL98200.1 hypothetical protein [Candidatus Dependentiae bacterium]